MRQFKSLAGVYVVFMIIALMVIVSGFFLYKRVSSLRLEIAEATSERDQLASRAETLRSVLPDVNSETTKSIANVLPSSNPAVLVVSQLRNEASKEELIFDKLSLSLIPSQNPGIEEVKLSFFVKGDYNKIATYVSIISKMAPYTNLTNAEISQKAETIEAYIELSAYWAPFPQTLPPITETITPLSDDDKEMLSEIKDFQAPVIQSSEIKAQEEEIRDNPFSFLGY